MKAEFAVSIQKSPNNAPGAFVSFFRCIFNFYIVETEVSKFIY